MSLEQLQKAKELIDANDFAPALEIINDVLNEDPSNPMALFLFGSVMVTSKKRGIAYNIYARCAKLVPDRPEVWVQFGRCQNDDEEGWKASEWCFQQALALDGENVAALSNMGSIMLQQCRADEGIGWLDKCLEINPDYEVAQSAKGFAHLMRGEWEAGWKLYHVMVGTSSRPKMIYGDLPEWDGTPGMNVLIHGEQGIGDELIYSSVIPDMAKNCSSVVYDCMPRLKTLMQRSFPENVYCIGGRWDKEVSIPKQFEPQATITQAGALQYYRKTDSDFPGEAYLKPDPGIARSMRSLLDGLSDRPKVGIAWTGGTKQSRQQFRQRTLEDLLPILRIPGVDFISLQYKDPSKEIAEFEEKRGIKIHHFPWITEEKNYDLTAGLVANLDLVIAVPTSVTQLAGAMGKETWVLVPKITGWLFNRDKYVWAKSVTLFRDRPFQEMAGKLKRWLEKRDGNNELLKLANGSR